MFGHEAIKELCEFEKQIVNEIGQEKMEYEVLEEGSAGFFGIGKRDAVILAHKKEEKIKEKKEEVKEKAKKPVKSAKKEVKNKKKDFKKDTKKEAKKEEEPVQQAVPKKQKEITPMNEATIKVCEEYLLSILKEMGLDAKVTSREEEDHSLYMDVSGEDMGLIIGKRGQTLDALQYLLNRVAGSHQDNNVRIKLDTEDYRERRKKTLENLARNIASKAKKTNRNVVLEPMNPYERMIIHSTLQQDPAVTTYSKGKEPYRTVVVALKK